MSIYLNKDSKIIVQGMTGGMGSKHTTLMVEAGSNIVGGVNARKAGTTVELGGKELPVFGSVEEAMKETGADVSVVFVPPAFTKDACIEAIDAGIGLLVVITEGVPVQDTAEVFAYLEGKATPDDRPELSRRHHPRGVAGRHHAAHHRRQGPDRAGVEVRHADLPDDVRAPRLRLHHRDRHRR